MTYGLTKFSFADKVLFVWRIQKLFECRLEVFFVATGTAANSLALSC